MNKMKKVITWSVIACLSITMVLLSACSTPTIEKTEYEGDGKITVHFTDDVTYDNTKITVKDTDENEYDTEIVSRDDDELTFKVDGIKAGESYSFQITGLKSEHGLRNISVSETFNVPKGSVKTTSRSKAINTAAKHAATKWNLSKTDFYDIEADKDTWRGKSVWEVSFSNGKYEFEYEISRDTGKILHYDRDLD